MSMNYSSKKLLEDHITPWRFAAVAGILGVWFGVLAVRAAYLQGLNTDFLQGKGDAVASRKLGCHSF